MKNDPKVEQYVLSVLVTLLPVPGWGGKRNTLIPFSLLTETVCLSFLFPLLPPLSLFLPSFSPLHRPIQICHAEIERESRKSIFATRTEQKLKLAIFVSKCQLTLNLPKITLRTDHCTTLQIKLSFVCRLLAGFWVTIYRTSMTIQAELV